MKYDHKAIERKWQERWEREKLGAAKDASTLPKSYVLVEFPYPSGDGLHVGHVRSYTALDAVARKRRMEGKNVLFPIGWDAFGLPTENYALKTGVHPREATDRNISNFRRQMKSLGLSFDWSREVDTTDPKYYRWTQWIFLKLLKAGLAYQATIPISWCPKDKIGLANEEVVNGKCERCGTTVERRMQKQWMLKITAYADRLLKDLDTVDYPDRIKTQQQNWIGRSEGAEVEFGIWNMNDGVRVFTTRPDTLFGATYLVLSPEHPLVDAITTSKQKKSVEKYRKQVASKSDLERTSLEKEKTGVFTGAYAVNPANNEKIPVWIADYVLMSYGTGAIMAVPAHDERDWEFQKLRDDLKKIQVVKPKSFNEFDDADSFPRFAYGILKGESHEDANKRGRKKDYDLVISGEYGYIGEGILMNSGKYDGLYSMEAQKAIVSDLEKEGKARFAVNYKLRDWVFSRQHYWGEPIPVVHCEKDGIVPVPEDQLPVELPVVEKYQPSGTGKSPLDGMKEWVNVKCPTCGGPAKRETDTMPNWAGSSWYFLRYCDPHNDVAFADPKKLKYWLPVDLYNGGMEHTTLHLLYSRFWHKFLYDQKLVPTPEPYQKRVSHGMVLASDGRKMSKSFGNVVNPDELVEQYGADSVRLYEMFMGPFEDAIPWDTKGIVGMRRFLDKVWRIGEKEQAKDCPFDVVTLTHETIEKVTNDLEQLHFNTAISALMILANAIDKLQGRPREEFEHFLLLLEPFAPHLTREMLDRLNRGNLIGWPKPNKKLLEGVKTMTIAIQVNGKLRGSVPMPGGSAQDDVVVAAMELENVKKFVPGTPKKVIFVKDRLINFVV